ncbi:CDP-archaeol synthase [Candidatus Peregrinibacteria bacterium]|jgi:CDP-2,3-bis-(O-geranylgeranyl)-sn-glycerol synthase|nr:CDP-archaeol synthase [Candidatus Peregrinibacteria bacterium]MBT3598472.1 CDP-archaeol synthase [Candidatus Peregrinibacteria bacterium]MBT4367133.1 CDP-archaeol synthase [Candidatus Peregrinibacteria bacterium]MBT4586002.1 CDP-archaeol synthase [Candidatus Peregrinibacteria bacterium]MBT6730859.1 CDP-archaeol synthase [Candidatus Peregrinibacteria bacterium]
MIESLITIFIATILFYTPAYFANMAPCISGRMKLPGGHPIAAEIFGAHKTWRGIYSGVIGGALGGYLLFFLSLGWIDELSMLDSILIGGVMGLGALIGDSVKSLIKRRLHITPGKPFPPWDQLDFIIGASLFTFLLIDIPLSVFLCAILSTPVLHLLVNILSYFTGFKDVWW